MYLLHIGGNILDGRDRGIRNLCRMTFTVSLLITGCRGAQENEGNIGTDCLVEGQVEPDTPLFFTEIESPVFFPGYIFIHPSYSTCPI